MVRGSGILWHTIYKDILVFEEEKNSPLVSYIYVVMTKCLREELKGRCHLFWLMI